MLNPDPPVSFRDSKKSRIKLYESGHSNYKFWRKIVKEKFYHSYGARTEAMPNFLVALEDLNSLDICGGCFGVQLARTRTLFSEIYLDKKIEHWASDLAGRSVGHEEIGEFSNLISYNLPGTAPLLLGTLPWLAWTMGIRYLLFTATDKVLQILDFLHFSYTIVEEHPGHKVSPAFKENWGSYYNHNPVSGIVDVRKSLQENLDLNFKKYFLEDCSILV